MSRTAVAHDFVNEICRSRTSTGETGIRLARTLKPRVVVMDCAMPGMSGLTATRQLLELLPDTSILTLSMYSEAHLVHQALKAGARGYLLKDALDLRHEGLGT